MRLAAIFSGGKDSVLALHRAATAGHEIVVLVTVCPELAESWMFHRPNVRWTELQAQALGLPHIVASTKGEKETELVDLKAALVRARNEFGAEGAVSGALASKYQKSRIDRLCAEIGMQSLAPLWGANPAKLWDEMLKSGFEIVIAAVAAEGLGKEWLGRKIDKPALKELKKACAAHAIHLGFEGGEAETFVLDAPLFKKRIVIESASARWARTSGTYEIENARLAAK